MQDAEANRMVRHALATLAYRAAKVLRDLSPGAARMRASPATRTPLELVSHLADLMAWGRRMAQGEVRWEAGPLAELDDARRRFFDELAGLDAALAAAAPPAATLEKLIQGPVADALTHVGQLALLRGMAGAPVRPESYARADIVAGRVGPEQAPPRAEFDGDASATTRPAPGGRSS